MQLLDYVNEEFRKRREHILTMRRKGIPVIEIARIEGVSRARIYQILKTAKRYETVAKGVLPHRDGDAVVPVVYAEKQE